MTYHFQICGMRICCSIPFELQITDESRPFLMEDGEFDLYFQFEPVPSLPPAPKDGIWCVNSLYCHSAEGHSVYRCASRESQPYARVLWRDDRSSELRCEYIAGQEKYLAYSRNILELLGLEAWLLRNGGLLLHSSLIRWNTHGILFSAPSGTGKSTQASLWEELEGAQILNGDRAGLIRKEAAWTAWGLPYAGSSGIYRNESADVSAIVVLRQAKENRISRIAPMEAVRYLYPELSIHRWDAGFANQAVDLVLQLVSEVPVYLLECLPDSGAVAVLKEKILKGESL